MRKCRNGCFFHYFVLKLKFKKQLQKNEKRLDFFSIFFMIKASTTFLFCFLLSGRTGNNRVLNSWSVTFSPSTWESEKKFYLEDVILTKNKTVLIFQAMQTKVWVQPLQISLEWFKQYSYALMTYETNNNKKKTQRTDHRWISGSHKIHKLVKSEILQVVQFFYFSLPTNSKNKQRDYMNLFFFSIIKIISKCIKTFTSRFLKGDLFWGS